MELLILPDSPRTGVAPLPAAGGEARILRHASGRPWIVGRWRDDEVDLAAAGPRQALVAGTAGRGHAVAVVGARSAAEEDHVLERVPGAFHVVVSDGGVTRARGALSTARQIFCTRVAGTDVAATGPGPLRALSAAPLDDVMLAARLLLPTGSPWPVSLRGLWRGVDQLDIGHWLVLDADGRASRRPWWRAPLDGDPLPVAAEGLRGALEAAVGDRVRDRVLSADLSGGLDSTALCFVAAHLGAELLTCHVTPSGEGNDDFALARLAADRLPDARHLVLPPDRPENLFDVPLAGETAATAVEGPPYWANGRSHVADLTARVATEGARTHLVGLGGDELFGVMPALLWSLWRRRPLTALPVVERRRRMNRWRAAATARALLDGRTFDRSLAWAAGRLADPLPALTVPWTDWLGPLRMPPWATGEAVDAVAGLLRSAAAASPAPLDPDRTRHQILASLAFEGTTMRQIDAFLDAPGRDHLVSWQAPLLDDVVVAAALRLRVEDRHSTTRFKPLLAQAVQDLVPAPVLRRTTKGEYSSEMFRGLESNRHRLLPLVADSLLARRGLVDADHLRRAVLDPDPLALDLGALQNTLACESWLRSPNVQAPAALFTTAASPPLQGVQS